jgi:hypothetical protein
LLLGSGTHRRIPLDDPNAGWFEGAVSLAHDTATHAGAQVRDRILAIRERVIGVRAGSPRQITLRSQGVALTIDINVVSDLSFLQFRNHVEDGPSRRPNYVCGSLGALE